MPSLMDWRRRRSADLWFMVRRDSLSESDADGLCTFWVDFFSLGTRLAVSVGEVGCQSGFTLDMDTVMSGDVDQLVVGVWGLREGKTCVGSSKSDPISTVSGNSEYILVFYVLVWGQSLRCKKVASFGVLILQGSGTNQQRQRSNRRV